MDPTHSRPPEPDSGDSLPPTRQLSPAQMQGLLAAAAGGVTRELRGWQPPSVEDLQKALPQYEIVAFIARGGMGAVYKGVQRSLDRTVAIKILPPDIVDDGEANYAQRFKQEARAMARFKHPGIVTVYEAGEVELGETRRRGVEETGRQEEGRALGEGRAFAPASAAEGDSRRLEDQPPYPADGGLRTARPTLLYFVMEFIEGTDVAQLVATHGQLPPQEAIRITTAVCDALAYAHARGVVHRDIKPSNIMIDADGQVKVADFGLAKVTAQDSSGLTKSSLAMGTPDFVAPEALVAGALVDQRADIYAVGVMLYQMLTGHIPRGRFSTISAVVPQSDPRLDAIVDKAMQTDREKRYSSAVEMKVDVESVCSSGFSPSPMAMTDGLKPELRARRRAPLLIAAAVIVLGAGAFLLQKPGTTGSNQPPSAPVPAWATLKPIPALLEGRAVKLWDAPGKIPSKSNYQWEDNALRIDGDALRAEVNLTSVIFRASVRMNPDAVDARLLLRLREGNGRNLGHYYVSVNNQRVELAHTDNRKPRQFGHWLLNRPYQPDEWLRVEVRLIGETIVVAADGAVLGIVRDALALEPGKIALYGKSKAYFRDVSYIQLDGVPEEELAALAGLPATASVASTSSSSATKDAPFTNTLGMKFVPVPGTKVLFSIWDTRVQDYAEYAKAQETAGKKVDGAWKTQNMEGVPVGREPDHPVVGVSWEDAQAYCQWLTVKETAEGKLSQGQRYRLPTDEEWSIAAGLPPEHGTTPEERNCKNDVDFPWGKEWPPTTRAGNYADESFHSRFPLKWNVTEKKEQNLWMKNYIDDYATTSPVGSFPANTHGLHDMGGNVWQWCEDWWNAEHKERVARGASWGLADRNYLRSSCRIHDIPQRRDNVHGFRCVLEAARSSAAAPDSSKTAGTKDAPFTNTLGMKFVPVPGTDVLFCIHETRWQDYAAYAAETPGADISWRQATHGAANTPTGHGDDHPVVSVSWEDAHAFCAWLGRREGRRYRLPTDREWSWAVGIGEQESTDRDPIGLSQRVQGIHPWGTSWPPPARAANLSDKAFLSCEPKGQIIEGYEDGFATTAPVMSFAPNTAGIHDLGGNVWEWCEDKARNQGETRAARGGAFDTWKQPSLLSSYRVENLPGYRHELWGFRIVMEKQP